MFGIDVSDLQICRNMSFFIQKRLHINRDAGYWDTAYNIRILLSQKRCNIFIQRGANNICPGCYNIRQPFLDKAELAICALVRASQPEKASQPSSDTCAGIKISCKETQPWKARDPMLQSRFGSCTFSMMERRSKASVAIFRTCGGIRVSDAR